MQLLIMHGLILPRTGALKWESLLTLTIQRFLRSCIYFGLCLPLER